MREYRIKRGMTRRELAIAVGCSESMIAKIEQGVKKPSLPMAGKISEALGKTVDRLFFAQLQDRKCGTNTEKGV